MVLGKSKRRLVSSKFCESTLKQNCKVKFLAHLRIDIEEKMC